jgi:hypothetical protein
MGDIPLSPLRGYFFNDSTDAGSSEGQWRRRAAVTAWQLRLISMATMRDTVREAGVHLITAEMEIGFTRMTKRPFANFVTKIEQAGLARNLCTWLGGHKAARWGRGGRWCLIAWPLAKEPARPD